MTHPALVLAGVLGALGLADVDERVQAAVARLGNTEAVVVLDVATGRVLGYRGAVERPLPPGSTFKIVDVLAAARVSPTALERTVECRGHAVLGGAKMRCPGDAPHGTLDLEGGLRTSCNLYFGTMGLAVGTRALLDEARRLGAGVTPGELPAPTAAPALVADGVGVRWTPLQYARLLRQVARGVRDDGTPITDATTLARLRRGLRAVVEDGTGQGAAATSVPVAGKTGTAPLGSVFVGWFGGYAPADAPSVVVVVVRRGVTGREVAALAPPVFDAFFHGHSSSGGDLPVPPRPAKPGEPPPTARSSRGNDARSRQ